MSSFFKDLGVGVGLRPTHYSDFLNCPPKSVQWIEVISENFISWQKTDNSKALHRLKKFRQNYPLHLHGVSLNIGSTDPLDFEYLKKIKFLTEQLQPEIISDHLSWIGVNGLNLHDLMPIPYTLESLKNISEKADQVQNFLGRPILLENPSSYFEYQQSEMTEWDFINTLIKSAGCGLLLDINNVYVSSINHDFNPYTYLANLPVKNIGQIHLAGHSTLPGGYLIDTHDEPVDKKVWDLYQWFTEKYGKYSTMIERDDNIPDWSELEKEIFMIHQFRNQAPHLEPHDLID